MIQANAGSKQKVYFLDLILLDQDETASGQLHKLIKSLGEKRTGKLIDRQEDLMPFFKANLVALV